jgi:hypothetical protein
MKKEELKELREGLKQFRGSMTKVAKRAKVSKIFVSYVLAGKRKSQRVLGVASTVLLELAQQRAEQASRSQMQLRQAKELLAQVA